MTQVADRLDEWGIRNLVDQYCYHVMTGDDQAWAATWTDAGMWGIPGDGVIHGVSSIRETFARIRSTYLFCVQELVGINIWMLDETHGRSRCMIRERQWAERDGEVVGTELVGLYEDEVTLVSGVGPRFASRDFQLLYSGAASADGRFHNAARNLSRYVPGSRLL